MEALTLDVLLEAVRNIERLPPAPQFIESRHLVIGPFEDWSEVRSPGRAARRRKKHPQRIRLHYKADPKLLTLPDGRIIGHPETLARLRTRLEAAHRPRCSAYPPI